MNSFLDRLDESISLIDIGCSDELQSRWKPIERKLRYIGFEPNKDECDRISKLPNNFKESLFLPYAIAGFTGKANIHITDSFYCTSLLQPDQKWLKRFEFADFFRIKSVQEIDVHSLDEIPELKTIDIDIIKIDSQGLELEILKSAKNNLKDAICVETESGFHSNYINESTQAEVDLFMRQNGFLLFGIMERRMPLNNKFKDYARPNAQVLWCECKWVKDLISADENGQFNELGISRSKALKYLLILAVQGIYDYGLAYAHIFNKYKLIDDYELQELSDISNWEFQKEQREENRGSPGSKTSSYLKLLMKKVILKNIHISSKMLSYLSK
jgi:FkbM family methyltransferase